MKTRATLSAVCLLFTVCLLSACVGAALTASADIPFTRDTLLHGWSIPAMTFGVIVRAPLPSPMPGAVLPSPGCAVALLLSPSVAGRRAVVALDRCLAIHAAGRGGDTSRALGFRHRTIPVRRTCYLSTCWERSFG
jgi:hypothetical protein